MEPVISLGNGVGSRELQLPGHATHARTSATQRLNRTVACFALDVLVLGTAYLCAFLLRFEGYPPPSMAQVMWMNMLLAVAMQYSILAALKVPRFSWSYISVRDLPPIVGGIAGATAVLLALRYGSAALVDEVPRLGGLMIPASVIVLDAVLATLGLVGARCLRRLQRHRRRRLESRPALPRTPAILVGAGTGGIMLLQELCDRADLGFVPVAFVDDDPLKVGRLIGGVRVAGTTAQLAAIAERYQAKVALITIASADNAAVHRIARKCDAAGLQAKIVPHMHEIATGRIRISQVRDVAIEDLLGRPAVVIENSTADTAVTGKVVLVTGAGGSIGSELCRQILGLRPKLLVLVERTENSLYEINRELAARQTQVRIAPELADVCDAARMAQIFDCHRPHAVFHAAAHKHVPMMELVPGEAIKNNVFGTKTVADLADRFAAERFILVSTDKAVNPSSVMGATKRLAELYIKELDARSNVRFTSVRFGNVMGSAGSVIPLFREQIAKGGPVTVTHPEMERFFMTIPEASKLVLEAAGLCDGGEVMVLDMGKPVKIRHLAEQMIRLSGFEPGEQIRIVYTGVRPGEKLHEELSLQEELVAPTTCQKLLVWRGVSAPQPMAMILHQLGSPGPTPEAIRHTLRKVLPEYGQGEPASIH